MTPHVTIRIAPSSATVTDIRPPREYERATGFPVESVTVVNTSARADLVIDYGGGRVILRPGMMCRFDAETVDGHDRWRAGLARNAMAN